MIMQQTQPKTEVDSLFEEVIEGHDEAMAAQMTKMKKAKEGVQHVIDSIMKLPGKNKRCSFFI